MASKKKNFSLDLGAAVVTVEVSDILNMEDKVGRADLANYRIVIADGLNGQDITSTLLHECFHFLDSLYLGGELDTNDGHSLIDRLSILVDMTIRRNWQVFRTLYDAHQVKEGK